MPIVKILNRDYSIACGEGEEKKLIEIADRLDKKLKENARLFKGASDNLLIILTALTMEDYIHDLEQKISSMPSVSSKEEDEANNLIIERLNQKVSNIIKQLSE